MYNNFKPLWLERNGANPMPTKLSQNDRQILLQVARRALEATANKEKLPALDLSQFSEDLQADGASFVTLTTNGQLRGCIGTLQAYQPLVRDVQARAVQAASEDPRFSPVKPEELKKIKIEVSRLTQPEPLSYDSPDQLKSLLRSGIDGVVISDGYKRATFLPQVWEDLPNPEQFLGHLCRKMGSSPNLWKHQMLEVETYQVEEFSEK